MSSAFNSQRMVTRSRSASPQAPAVPAESATDSTFSTTSALAAEPAAPAAAAPVLPHEPAAPAEAAESALPHEPAVPSAASAVPPAAPAPAGTRVVKMCGAVKKGLVTAWAFFVFVVTFVVTCLVNVVLYALTWSWRIVLYTLTWSWRIVCLVLTSPFLWPLVAAGLNELEQSNCYPSISLPEFVTRFLPGSVTWFLAGFLGFLAPLITNLNPLCSYLAHWKQQAVTAYQSSLVNLLISVDLANQVSRAQAWLRARVF